MPMHQSRHWAKIESTKGSGPTGLARPEIPRSALWHILPSPTRAQTELAAFPPSAGAPAFNCLDCQSSDRQPAQTPALNGTQPSTDMRGRAALDCRPHQPAPARVTTGRYPRQLQGYSRSHICTVIRMIFCSMGRIVSDCPSGSSDYTRRSIQFSISMYACAAGC